jgi:hypothetical protein
MSLVTGGMGGLGSICCLIAAQDGMGPIMTTSRTGALPGGASQRLALEGIMGHCPHFSIRADMSASSVTADLFAWIQKMGKNGMVMEQQVLNIDEISNTLKYQMSFTEKRKSSMKSTLELMSWVRDRYAAALEELKKKVPGSAEPKSKKELEDMMLNFQESEVKIGELIADIKRKLNIPAGSMVSENALKQIRQKAAKLSNAVADVERMSCLARDPVLDSNRVLQELSKQDVQQIQVDNLMNCVSRIQSEKSTESSSPQWIVVGGGENQGIFVQYGSEAMSGQFPERLATGARIEELAMSVDGKLLYSKIQGEGPECGWVHLSQQGMPLVTKVIETELE